MPVANYEIYCKMLGQSPGETVCLSRDECHLAATGDQVFAAWNCTGTHTVGCTGRFTLMDGTGRFNAIAGNGDLRDCHMLVMQQPIARLRGSRRVRHSGSEGSSPRPRDAASQRYPTSREC